MRRIHVLLISFLLFCKSLIYGQVFQSSASYSSDIIEQLLNLNTYSSSADSNYKWSSGIISNTLHERHMGGFDNVINGLIFLPDSIETNGFDDSIKPLIIADIEIDQGLLFKDVILGKLKNDSSVSDFQLLQYVISLPFLKNIEGIEGDTFIENSHFVMSSYTIPLPCSHYPIYCEYWGKEDVTLSIDNTFAAGLSLDEVLPFIKLNAFHIRNFHGSHCESEMNKVVLHIHTRNVDINKIASFTEELTKTNTKLKILYPEN